MTKKYSSLQIAGGFVVIFLSLCFAAALIAFLAKIGYYVWTLLP